MKKNRRTELFTKIFTASVVIIAILFYMSLIIFHNGLINIISVFTLVILLYLYIIINGLQQIRTKRTKIGYIGNVKGDDVVFYGIQFVIVGSIALILTLYFLFVIFTPWLL